MEPEITVTGAPNPEAVQILLDSIRAYLLRKEQQRVEEQYSQSLYGIDEDIQTHGEEID